MKKKIVILTLDHSPRISASNSLLKHLALNWQQRGFQVEVVQGIDREIKADIIFSHINLTHVPEEYTAFLDKYPVVINGKATDISKTSISHNLLTIEDDYKGPVIIKTIANYGGIPELKRQVNLGHIQTTAIHQRAWDRVESLDPYNYPRFDSIEEIPYGIWKNKKLIVEKFLPETDEDGNYRLRTWFVFGDKELGKIECSNNPTVKDDTFNKEIIETVPEKLRVMRKRLGIDFARFDYAVVDGEAVVYDINTTPVILDDLSFFGDKISDLAAGIDFYFNV